jgi:hypothetical protein
MSSAAPIIADVVVVSKDHVGYLIGPKGARHQDLVQKSGVISLNIGVLNPADADNRLVLICGIPEAVASAKTLLTELLDAAPAAQAPVAAPAENRQELMASKLKRLEAKVTRMKSKVGSL